MKDEIVQAKQIDEQSKLVGFYQEVLDHVVRQGFANTWFEVNSEEGLDAVDEFCPDPESVEGQKIVGVKQADGFIKDIHQGLQQSVQALN